MYRIIPMLILLVLFGASCSKTVEGPVSGKKYNVNVGGWSDMEKYKQARDEVSEPIKPESKKDRELECSTVDCPDNGQ